MIDDCGGSVFGWVVRKPRCINDHENPYMQRNISKNEKLLLLFYEVFSSIIKATTRIVVIYLMNIIVRATNNRLDCNDSKTL